MGDDRPSRYTETDDEGNTTVVYRASGLGGCPRSFVASARDYYRAPTPQFMLDIFNEGHVYEDTIRGMFEDKTGHVVTDDQEELELYLGVMHGNRVIIRGHIDGKYTTEDGEVGLFEAKKIRTSGWKNFLRKKVEVHESYPWQLSTYMIGLEAVEASFTGGHLDGDEMKEVEVFTYTDPPISLKAIIKWVQGIEDLIAEGWDAPEVDCTNKYPCPYFKIHDLPPEDYDLDPETFTDVVEELAVLTAAHREAKAKADKLEKLKKAATQQLIELLATEGGDAPNAKKLILGEHVLSHVKSDVKESVITRAAYTSEYFKFTKPKTTKKDTK